MRLPWSSGAEHWLPTWHLPPQQYGPKSTLPDVARQPGHPPSAAPTAPRTAGVLAVSEVYVASAPTLIVALPQPKLHGTQAFPSAMTAQSVSTVHAWS
jgi:hypothetical protein